MKTAAAIISAALMLNMGISVNAENVRISDIDNMVIRRLDYTYLNSVSGSLSISGKKASCTSNVYGYSNSTDKIKVTQTLQKKNGGSWNNVAIWNSTYYSWYCNCTNSKSSLASGTYRLKTVATVYSGSNSEKATSYSGTVTC